MNATTVTMAHFVGKLLTLPAVSMLVLLARGVGQRARGRNVFTPGPITRSNEDKDVRESGAGSETAGMRALTLQLMLSPNNFSLSIQLFNVIYISMTRCINASRNI